MSVCLSRENQEGLAVGFYESENEDLFVIDGYVYTRG